MMTVPSAPSSAPSSEPSQASTTHLALEIASHPVSKPRTKSWATYFAQNTKRWQQFADGVNFQTIELKPVFIESIKTFQLGEQSEGRTLKALAEQYSIHHNDPDYLVAIQQFIAEEQRHATYLAQALQANESETFSQQWSDGLFRKLRQLCGWEMMISVLLTAEVIAITYYSSLVQASSEPQAKQLFERILQDEAIHLQFHGEYLCHARSRNGAIRWQGHRLFLFMVATLVWCEHRHILKCNFSSFVSFAKRCDTLLMNLTAL
ncbi:MAG: ferritin-like domain-containing protein [Phormidesmis sp. RL_2_1]|nr:ferritin-like domain-containing protein [Phormidesmis sp. RL_2_1]